MESGKINEFGSLTATDFPEPTEPTPSLEEFERWAFDSVCSATDGCTVEPDGVCEHGYPSWLIYAGLI